MGRASIRVVCADSEALIAGALDIRRRVFVEEQGIPAELDDDGEDTGAIHVVALDGEQPVATARLSPQAEPGFAVLARVAVLPPWRSRGLGQALVRELERLGAAAGIREIELHPHEYLEGFYSALGYHTVSGGMVVGEHRLIVMRRRLPAPA